MKNCLIVLVVLFLCFIAAVALEFFVNENGGRGFPRGQNYAVATWRDYGDPGLNDMQVTISTDEITIDTPPKPDAKATGGPVPFDRVVEKGHWRAHGFYCDSHLDAPTEIKVATELKNEDLELDAGHFFPGQSGTVTLVKVVRILDDVHSPYPVNVPGQKVSYPPPKGLIRPGMLEWDLQMLPWHADKIEVTGSVVNVYENRLSDGKQNNAFFTRYNNDGEEDQSEVYTYHSDRQDAPPLLVTVDRGRVTQVVGGAEDTADIPYVLPPAAPDAEESTPPTDSGSKTWPVWLFDMLFKK
jgi:hypothetical protein